MPAFLDASWYLTNNPDVAAAIAAGTVASAEEHFNLYGKFEGRSPSPFFDANLYLAANPDVAAAIEAGAFATAYDHFVQYGLNEGRDASPFFNADYYLAHNPDVAQAVANGQTTALNHFLTYGAGEQRTSTPLFNIDYYLSSNPDVAAALDAGLISSAFEHFMQYGLEEGRPTSPYFDLAGYLNANPDVASAVQNGVITPFDHFMLYGFKEGRDLGNGVSLALFADDPVTQQAIATNDFEAVLARVEQVAPFVSTYHAPAGYTIPANTPVPVDFVPVKGETLIVPDGVTVPADLTLPDTIRPSVYVKQQVGTVDGSASQDTNGDGVDDAMYYGGSNPNGNFVLVRDEYAGVELALKAKEFGPNGGDYAHVSIDQNGIAHYTVSTGASPDNAARADWSLDYAVTVLPHCSDAFTFKLLIDIDATEGVNLVEIPTAPVNELVQGSSNYGFNFIKSQIDIDPNTNGIQPYAYGEGTFDIVLQALDGQDLVASNTIRVHVSQDDLLI